MGKKNNITKRFFSSRKPTLTDFSFVVALHCADRTLKFGAIIGGCDMSPRMHQVIDRWCGKVGYAAKEGPCTNLWLTTKECFNSDLILAPSCRHCFAMQSHTTYKAHKLINDAKSLPSHFPELKWRRIVQNRFSATRVWRRLCKGQIFWSFAQLQSKILAS